MFRVRGVRRQTTCRVEKTNAIAFVADPSFSTFSRSRRSSSGMSHFDSFVSVCGTTSSTRKIDGRYMRTYVIVVFSSAREVFFPLCLVQRALSLFIRLEVRATSTGLSHLERGFQFLLYKSQYYIQRTRSQLTHHLASPIHFLSFVC